ncbi:hypothetical protein [Streptomyces sp. NPDC093984]|uniref:hypothetical protein n=1 Tax=Streptomyces sp. NPDC093984 TaxID=3366052 RepID=UPI00380472DE
MSVSRTALRLIAACVASGALVGATALPALADGGSHIREQGSSYAHSDRVDTVRGHDHDRGYRHGHDHDRDRFHGWDRDRGRHHGWYGDRHHGWYGDRHHGWYGDRHHDRRLGDWLRDRSRHHGWYGEQRHHGHHAHRR